MSWQDLSLIEKQAIVNRDEAAIKKRLRENIMSIDAPSVKMGLLSVAWKEDGEGLEMSSFSKGILYKYGIKAEWELGQEYGQKKYSIEPDPEKAFQYFEQAEKEEEPLAYYELAMCYADGRGTERNVKKAREYLRGAVANEIEGLEDYISVLENQGKSDIEDWNKEYKSAIKRISKGDSYAQYYAARAQKYGWGTVVNGELALIQYSKAEEAGQPLALFAQGLKKINSGCSEEGWKILERVRGAFRTYKDTVYDSHPSDIPTLLREAERIGEWEFLGGCYMHGIGVNRDIEQAEGYFAKCNIIYNTSDFYNLLPMYYLLEIDRNGLWNNNLERKVFLYRTLYERVKFLVNLNYLDVVYLKTVAACGWTRAQECLGKLYMESMNFVEHHRPVDVDTEESLKWFSEALKETNGKKESRTEFLFAYEVAYGKGNKGKYGKKAIECCRHIIRDGQSGTDIQKMLCDIYVISDNKKEAFRLAKECADQGDINFYVRLANMYAYEIGIARDVEMALYYLKKAIENGNDKIKREAILSMKQIDAQFGNERTHAVYSIYSNKATINNTRTMEDAPKQELKQSTQEIDFSILGLILSVIGMCSVNSLPAIAGLVLGIKGLKSEKRNMAIGAIVIAVIGILISIGIIIYAIATG